jgi:hypothetical protein
MASLEQTIIARFSPLRAPGAKIAKSKVQIGDSSIADRFPPLRVLPPAIAKSGKVQLGDSSIRAQFPPRK